MPELNCQGLLWNKKSFKLSLSVGRSTAYYGWTDKKLNENMNKQEGYIQSLIPEKSRFNLKLLWKSGK